MAVHELLNEAVQRPGRFLADAKKGGCANFYPSGANNWVALTRSSKVETQTCKGAQFAVNAPCLVPQMYRVVMVLAPADNRPMAR
jgi:hypothetical protein